MESDPPPSAPDGTRVVRVDQGGRIEVQLPGAAPYTAAQIVEGSSRDLPIGSSFDAAEGKFYWQPAAGLPRCLRPAVHGRHAHRAPPRRRRAADPDGDRHAARGERARRVGLHAGGLGRGSRLARRRGDRHAARVGVSGRRRCAGVRRRRPWRGRSGRTSRAFTVRRSKAPASRSAAGSRRAPTTSSFTPTAPD